MVVQLETGSRSIGTIRCLKKSGPREQAVFKEVARYRIATADPPRALHRKTELPNSGQAMKKAQGTT